MSPKTYRYAVSGPKTSLFPLDMLRTDRAWPSSTADALAIAASFGEWSLESDRRRVNLIGLDEPTRGRWTSFGWHVEREPPPVRTVPVAPLEETSA